MRKGGPQQFRPATPPAVSSLEYATALAEVRDLGRDTSTSRTVDQTVAGKFWSASPIWTTWNQVAQQLVTDRHADLAQATAVFSALDLSLADTTLTDAALAQLDELKGLQFLALDGTRISDK